MIQYAIVDSGYVRGTAGKLAAAGVDYVQLRDKAASAGVLLALAKEILGELQGSETRLLINSRADIALAAGAHGVHLTSHPDALTPAQVRQVYAGLRQTPVISISCHTAEDVARAVRLGVDLILFGPVFEKRLNASEALPGVGLEGLSEACRVAAPTPVLALGGVTAGNVQACLEAGAAGFAAIRWFAELQPQ